MSYGVPANGTIVEARDVYTRFLLKSKMDAWPDDGMKEADF